MKVIEAVRLEGVPPAAVPLHPAHEVLLRFARGAVSMAERKAVVAHLLGRCETCAASIWEAAGLPALGSGPLTSNEEASAPRRCSGEERE
jgi:anti-sigma factor ChrR (cupin superfamily)